MLKSRFIVFRDHLIPNCFGKKVSTLTQYLMKTNNITKQNAKQITLHIDKSQERKLRLKLKDYQSEQSMQINKQIQKFIHPVKQCPQYFLMLVQEYEKNNKQKLEKYSQKRKKLNRNQVNKNDSIFSTELIKQTLFQHPKIKQKIYKEFQQAYKNYKLKNPSLLNLLSQGQIFYIPPLLFSTSIQIFQKQNPNVPFQECHKILQSNKKLKEQYEQKISTYTNKHIQDMMYICQKTKFEIVYIFRQYAKQFSHQQKNSLLFYG